MNWTRKLAALVTVIMPALLGAPSAAQAPEANQASRDAALLGDRLFEADRRADAGVRPELAQARAFTHGTADDPPGFVLWTADHVAEVADRLEQTIGDKPIVYETIRNADGHSVYLVLRGATGRAEFHETEADLYAVRRGRATLLLGGELVGAEVLPRKQQRGSGVRGGTRRELRPGDIVYIPIGVPHQLVIAPGDRFMYDLVKFNEEPLP